MSFKRERRERETRSLAEPSRNSRADVTSDGGHDVKVVVLDDGAHLLDDTEVTEEVADL